MATNLGGRRLLVAGDPRAAAITADASGCGAIVALAADTRGGDWVPAPEHAISYDGRSEADVERAFDVVLDRMHGLDGLICVIETDTMPPFDEAGAESWERRVSQPLRTAFWLVRRSVHEWLASGRGGQIVLMVSPGGGEGAARAAWVLESALVSLARSIAKEYGRRAITCNVVAGGSTPAAGRAAAEAALFLVSPGAGFVTGECLHVGDDSMQGS